MAIDLPGHGQSDWRGDRDYRPSTSAVAVPEAIARVAPTASLTVGMSLGALVAVSMAAHCPDLVRGIVLVDALHSAKRVRQEMRAEYLDAVAFIGQDREFDTFDEMVDRRSQHLRAEPSSDPPGVRYNSVQLPSGPCRWRYNRIDDLVLIDPVASEHLWEQLASIAVPMILVCGGNSPFVTEDDRRCFRHLRRSDEIVTIAGSGHAVQSDQPALLAATIRHWFKKLRLYAQRPHYYNKRPVVPDVLKLRRLLRCGRPCAPRRL